MKKISLYLLFLLFAASCSKKIVTPPVPTPPPASYGEHDFRKTPPVAGPAPKIQIGKAEQITLDNGLKVIVVPNSKLPRVSFQVFVDADPQIEGNAAGYVEMMGELLSKGTTTMTKAQIDEKIDFIGASFSSSATGVSGTCLVKHADALLSILSDVLLNPAFPETELKKAKLRQQSNLAQAKDDANTISSNVASVLNFGSNHPYGEVMTEETLERIDLAAIRKHYDTWFKPNISYFVVVGDVTKAQAETWAKKYFGSWKRGEITRTNYSAPAGPTRAELSFVHKPGAVQSVVSVTYPVDLKPGTSDAIPASVMNTLLGGYFNSRLNQNLREGRGFTYGARSTLSPDPIATKFNAYASVRNEVTDSSVVEFLKEMNRIRNEKIPRDELSVVKSVMTGNFASSLESPETVARFALNTARYNLPADYYATYLQKLSEVSPDDVTRMAMKYIRPDRAYILVVGDKSIAEGLSRFSTDRKVRYYDVHGKPVVENTLSLPEGLHAEKVIINYLTAIGGEDALRSVKDITREGQLKGVMPVDVSSKFVQKKGNKSLLEMKVGPQVLMKIVFDGKQGYTDGIDGRKPLEGNELKNTKRAAVMFPELNYNKDIYSVLLKGIEIVGDQKAYVIEITDASGYKITNYYSAESYLKLRDMRTVVEDGETRVIVQDYEDYRDVSGVKIPFTTRLNGVFPVPAKVVYDRVTINGGVSDELFEMK